MMSYHTYDYIMIESKIQVDVQLKLKESNNNDLIDVVMIIVFIID